MVSEFLLGAYERTEFITISGLSEPSISAILSAAI
jgi:hypothetical protein